MTLLNSFGHFVDEMAASGYAPDFRLESALDGGSNSAMSKSLGLVQIGVTDILSSCLVDWVVLAGDRAEQLAAALASCYSRVPSAHIQAGERSGHVDGVARHAIARLANLHFASNEEAANRLLRSGEQAWRVIVSGSPQLDFLQESADRSSSVSFRKQVGYRGAFILACYHPVAEEFEVLESHVECLLDVLRTQELPVHWILPNNDAGSPSVRDLILKGVRTRDRIDANLSRELYLSRLKDCEFLIGNSSSGIIEAPSFQIPAINLGRRQIGRLRASNVVDVPEVSRLAIQMAIDKVRSPSWRQSLTSLINPYGDGTASLQIIETLERVKGDKEILSKSITY